MQDGSMCSGILRLVLCTLVTWLLFQIHYIEGQDCVGVAALGLTPLPPDTRR